MCDKGLFLLLGLAVSLGCSAHALDCYSCYNLNQGPCFNVSQITTNRTDLMTCSVHSRNLEYEMRRVYGPNFEHKTRSIFDVKCVRYEKYYHLTKSTETFRGCLQRKYAKEFCAKQAANQEYYYYNLTGCNVCSSDMCNSSVNSHGNYIVVLFLVASAKYFN